jgi:hypothetical protein
MSPAEAFDECLSRGERIPELELIIAKSESVSYRYANEVLKGRFEKGEEEISWNLHYSYHYAVNVLKGPFYLCHPYIFNSSYKERYISFLKSINYDMKEIEEQYGEWLI